MVAREIRIRGIVQGVGFRPFIYNLAIRHGLKGYVLNDTEGVYIRIMGERESVENFIATIPEEKPVPSHIEEMITEEIELFDSKSFRIKESRRIDSEVTAISPDLATCKNCVSELFDPDNRRYGYPFINCTHCGPRYSIIKDLPYDRPQTSMDPFAMCDLCREEYTDVTNRRFHAQPNACATCGPHYSLLDSRGNPIDTCDPIAECCEMLNRGKIIAVKGIGGFHLMADAGNEETINELRKRKNRPAKPFALMVRDTGVAGMICYLSKRESDILESPIAPILLLKTRGQPSLKLPKSIAPGLDRLGLFLPYAPIHHLIFALSGLTAIIATSGNRRDEPIVSDNDEAVRDLSGIADGYLVHNRKIIGRSDDSVGFVFRDEMITVRRSRGIVPRAIKLPVTGPSVLAVGADLKNTFAITRGNQAFLSPYLGDMVGDKSLGLFKEVLSRYLDWLNITPEIVICDLHPDYVTTVLAEDYSRNHNIPLYRIQHHAAHGISVMAEQNLPDEPAITIALDGHGYGSDKTIWGGEFLLTEYTDFKRLGHILRVPQPGGDTAAIDVRRMALSWAYAACGDNIFNVFPDLYESPGKKLEPILNIIEARKGHITSSAGRLFDAVSCLSGICRKNTYEAECPQRLMSTIDPDEMETYPFEIENNILDPRPAIRTIGNDLAAGVDSGLISARFHNGFAKAIVAIAANLASNHGIKRVLLSGGVFQNMALLNLVVNGLSDIKLEPYYNRLVPPGDAGVALGQALFGISILKSE